MRSFITQWIIASMTFLRVCQRANPIPLILQCNPISNQRHTEAPAKQTERWLQGYSDDGGEVMLNWVNHSSVPPKCNAVTFKPWNCVIRRICVWIRLLWSDPGIRLLWWCSLSGALLYSTLLCCTWIVRVVVQYSWPGAISDEGFVLQIYEYRYGRVTFTSRCSVFTN